MYSTRLGRQLARVSQWLLGSSSSARESKRHTEASKGVLAVDVHGAGAADTLAATSAERQGRVDLVLDADDGVEHHGAGLVEVNGVALQARLLGGRVRVPAVDLERLEARLLLLDLADGGHGARKGNAGAKGRRPGGAEDSRRVAKSCHFSGLSVADGRDQEAEHYEVGWEDCRQLRWQGLHRWDRIGLLRVGQVVSSRMLLV